MVPALQNPNLKTRRYYGQAVTEGNPLEGKYTSIGKIRLGSSVAANAGNQDGNDKNNAFGNIHAFFVEDRHKVGDNK
jgi:hypothetical protein